MAKYNSANDVISGHISALIEKHGLNPKDYPYQNDINSALNQLTAVYATISGKTAAIPADAFTISGALDTLLDVVDSIVSGQNP